jgi:hypothetical protein
MCPRYSGKALPPFIRPTVIYLMRIVTVGIRVGDELTPPFHHARPIPPCNMMVARTKGYTCDLRVWVLCIVQEPFSVASCQNLTAWVCGGVQLPSDPRTRLLGLTESNYNVLSGRGHTIPDPDTGFGV